MAMEGIRCEVQEQKLFALEIGLTRAEAEELAMSKRTDAFGLISKFFYRPKAEDIHLVYAETRYEPFWHVVCSRSIEYLREREFRVPLEAMVTEVKIEGKTYKADRQQLVFKGMERCRDQARQKIFVDAHTGKRGQFDPHVTAPKRELAAFEELRVDDTIVVPAKTKASSVMREVLSELLKPVQADEILEEAMVIEAMNLYFRPIHAFEFDWLPQEKRAVFEIDAVTRDWVWGRAVKETLADIFTPANLFEIGSETLGLVVPGGGLAAKLAKAVISNPNK